jgi:hypothetical protein
LAGAIVATISTAVLVFVVMFSIIFFCCGGFAVFAVVGMIGLEIVGVLTTATTGSSIIHGREHV